MNKKIEDFLIKNYHQLLSIAKKITKSDEETSRELLHEVLLQLYQREQITLKDYNDDSIRYYLTSIMRVNYYSNTSPYHYRIRKERLRFSDLNDIMDMPDEQEVFETQLIFDILEQEFAELNWFHKSLFEMYLTLGSLKKVSNKTNIPITSISRYINEAKKQTRINIINKLNG